MLVIAGCVARTAALRAVIAVVFIIGQAYRPTAKRAETDAQLLWRTQDHETPDGASACSCTAPRSTARSGLRDDDGEPITGPPPMITYYHPDSRWARR